MSFKHRKYDGDCRKEVWSAKLALDRVGFHYEYAEVLLQHHPDRRDTIEQILTSIDLPISLVKFVASPITEDEVQTRLEKAIEPHLEGRSADEIYQCYESTLKSYMVGWTRDMLKVEIVKYKDIKTLHDLYILPESKSSVMPTWKESLACWSKGVFYDIYKAKVHRPERNYH